MVGTAYYLINHSLPMETLCFIPLADKLAVIMLIQTFQEKSRFFDKKNRLLYTHDHIIKRYIPSKTLMSEYIKY
jgi:hypothetical protein